MAMRAILAILGYFVSFGGILAIWAIKAILTTMDCMDIVT